MAIKKMKDYLESLVNVARKYAELRLVKLGMPILPTWVILTKDYNLDVQVTAWKDEGEKYLAKVYMKKVLKAHQAIAYSGISEAWMAVYPADTRMDQLEELPRDRQDKKEVVMAFATDGEDLVYRTWEIVRDWNEKIIRLKEHDLAGDIKPEGWMLDLLS